MRSIAIPAGIGVPSSLTRLWPLWASEIPMTPRSTVSAMGAVLLE